MQNTQEMFRIKTVVIRRKGKKFFVKRLGYPELFNSWVDNKELVNYHSQKSRKVAITAWNLSDRWLLFIEGEIRNDSNF